MRTASAHDNRTGRLSGGTWAAWVEVLERWVELRRQRRRLLELSDAMLRDLGLTRADADREGSRWFWDLPERRR